jgi:hypothetical protein
MGADATGRGTTGLPKVHIHQFHKRIMNSFDGLNSFLLSPKHVNVFPAKSQYSVNKWLIQF